MQQKSITILAVSGSLRSTSSNTVIVRAIGRLLPAYVNYIVYEDLGKLPHFNDTDDESPALQNWRAQITNAQGVLICTPEYAFGVPGTLKNALDWTVSSGEFVDKKVALITASSSGEKAHAALLNILTAISSDIVEGAVLLIPFVRSKLNDKGEISDVATLQSVQAVIAAFLKAIENPAAEKIL